MGLSLVRELRFPQEDKKRKEKSLFHSEKRDVAGDTQRSKFVLKRNGKKKKKKRNRKEGR